jgi:hypothetical protein
LDWDAPARGLTIGDIDADGDDDIVFLAVDGSLHAFRNDATGPTISVRAAAGCDATGAVVTVTAQRVANETSRSTNASYQTLLSRRTYGGAHAAAVIVGAPAAVRARVEWVNGSEYDTDTDIETAGAGTGRLAIVAFC